MSSARVRRLPVKCGNYAQTLAPPQLDPRYHLFVASPGAGGIIVLRLYIYECGVN
jgi:hypothetical protein